MDTKKYRAYIATIEEQSLTAAAARLNYTQPGMTHIINSLEQELGFALLHRSKTGVVPTEDGKRVHALLKQLIQIEDQLYATANQIQGVLAGSLRIGGYFSVLTKWMPDFIPDFTSQFPQIELQLFEGEYDEQVLMLKNNQIDIALLSSQAPRGYSFIPLLLDPAVAIVPEKHPLAEKEEIISDELLNYPIITQHQSSAEEIHHVFENRGIIITGKYTVKSDSAIIALVQKGFGVALTSALLVSPPPRGIRVLKLEQPYPRTLGIAFSPRKQETPAIKALIKALCTKYRAANFDRS